VIRRGLIPLVGVVVGGGFYLLLIDTTSLPELYVLAGVAVGCGVAFGLAREQGFVEASIRPGWLLGAGRLLLTVPRDIVYVCLEAVTQLIHPRPVRGSFRSVRFAADLATPGDTGRRALAETLGSVAPNTIVVGVDAERGVLVVHQLRRSGPPEALDVMRLG
jgi:Na+/H+ ion antiporter subunit